tara:strand:- start:1727 stop:4222 length:2496 start_codon:yes stop_codon:yes gene_type:complete
MGLLMKLKNGDTSFKSLKFGKDRPGGGDSNQPYIKTPIGDQAENTAIDGDGIIRGGLTAPSRALEDVTRLSKYFFDFKNPNGLLFTVKQNLLSRIAVKAETATGPAYGGFTKSRTVLGGVPSDGFTKNNGTINDGIYTPLSTLGQAAVGYLGQHINKQGLDPTGNFPNASINKYSNVVFERNKADRNGEGLATRSIIPFNLIRKEQRANQKLYRATLQQSNAEDKATNEQNKRPEDRGILFGYSTEEEIQGSLTPNSLRRGNNFLEKWDAYRDQQTQKRLEKKNAKAENAQTNKDIASKNVQDASEEKTVYYDNRLLNLWDSKGLNLSKPLGTLDSILYSYGGGPNSIVGVGQTNIKFATLNDGITPARTGYSGNDPYLGDYNYSTNKPIVYSTVNIFGNPANPTSVSLFYLNGNPSVTGEQLFGNNEGNYLVDRDNSENIQPWLSGDYVRSLTGIVPDSVFSRVLRGATWSKTDFNQEEKNTNQRLRPDFRKRLVSDQTKTFIAKSPDYLKENQEKRVGIGRFNDPGQIGDISDYSIGKKDRNTGKVLGPTDRINALPILEGNLPKNDDFYNDFIRFRISILDPSRKGKKQHIIFRAFLDDLSDDYSAKWNSTEYIGRGEKFYKYQGFDRSVNVGFTLAALSKQELLPMYRKLNFLASSLAPSYTDAGYMAGNITELSVGDWFYQQPGILESVNIGIPQESPWDIQIPVEGKKGGDGVGADFSDISTKELPFILKVKMKFTPIHKFLPKIQSNTYNRSQLSDSEGNMIDGNTYGKERFIALGDNKNNGYLPKNSEGKSTSIPPPIPPDTDQNLLPPPDVDFEEEVVDIID